MQALAGEPKGVGISSSISQIKVMFMNSFTNQVKMGPEEIPLYINDQWPEADLP